MKFMLTISTLLAGTAAQAHPSLVPHMHPHGTSMLPDVGTVIVGGIVVLALAFVAYSQYGRT